MRRITRAEALCLRVRDYRESSKLVTLFTCEHGLITCIARGARRPRSKYGAALDLFARSRVIYHYRDNRGLYNLSDAELLASHAALALDPARFLAAEQMAELCLRTLHPLDPHPRLYQLLAAYLPALVTTPADTRLLVCSFLLKAASFLGYRPELRRCTSCDRPVEAGACFDPDRGGLVCFACAGQNPRLRRLTPADAETLRRLLSTPAAELPSADCDPPTVTVLPMVLEFLATHFDTLVLNSFRESVGLT